MLLQRIRNGAAGLDRNLGRFEHLLNIYVEVGIRLVDYRSVVSCYKNGRQPRIPVERPSAQPPDPGRILSQERSATGATFVEGRACGNDGPIPGYHSSWVLRPWSLPTSLSPFRRTSGPIFENSCWKCHGGAVQLSKLDLRSRESRAQGRPEGRGDRSRARPRKAGCTGSSRGSKSRPCRWTAN